MKILFFLLLSISSILSYNLTDMWELIQNSKYACAEKCQKQDMTEVFILQPKNAAFGLYCQCDYNCKSRVFYYHVSDPDAEVRFGSAVSVRGICPGYLPKEFIIYYDIDKVIR
jgi:hypothetical protein